MLSHIKRKIDRMFHTDTEEQDRPLNMDLHERITAAEQQLFDMLTSTVQERKLTVVLRCAGGWVRDNLLGLGSNDIDIAVEGMSGTGFANQVEAYLREHGLGMSLKATLSNQSILRQSG